MSKVEERKDRHGIIRSMAAAEGYVMVRRPGCMPFVLSGKEWARMRTPAAYDEHAAAYDKAMRPIRG